MEYAYKAHYTIDMLISTLPIILILYITFVYINMGFKGFVNIQEREKVRKLFVISEYIVKDRAVNKNGQKIINWIDDSSLSVDVTTLEKRMELENLYIGFESKGKVCIYRFVVFGEEKKIKRLFVCAD